jgi:hypothetical protein
LLLPWMACWLGRRSRTSSRGASTTSSTK